MITRARQRGMSLIVGLIMLVLITLLVVTSFNISSSHLIVVNNAQVQTELDAAANAAIEKSISSPAFTDATYQAGKDIKVGQFEGTADGTAAKTEVTVNVKASCEKARTLSNKEAHPISAECIWDPDTGGAYIEGKTSAANDSLCSESLWDVSANAKAPHDDRAKTELHQGVVVNTSRTVTSNCGS